MSSRGRSADALAVDVRLAAPVAGVGDGGAVAPHCRQDVEPILRQDHRVAPVPVREPNFAILPHPMHEGEVCLEGPRLAGEVMVERVGEEVRQLAWVVEGHDMHQPELLLAGGHAEKAHFAAKARPVHGQLDFHQRLGTDVRPAGKGDAGRREAFTDVGQEAFPVEHLKNPGRRGVKEKGLVEHRGSRLGVIGQRLRSRDGQWKRPEVGA